MGKVIEFRKGGGLLLPTIFDIAQAFLSIESMTHKKLQKLCYYAQAWKYALYGEVLFHNDFQAWVHGPVSPELYQVYKLYGWSDIPQAKEVNLTEENLDFIKQVYDTYGEFSGDELEALTHMEDPWKNARVGLDSCEPSQNIINIESMGKYYQHIYESSQND